MAPRTATAIAPAMYWPAERRRTSKPAKMVRVATTMVLLANRPIEVAAMTKPMTIHVRASRTAAPIPRPVQRPTTSIPRNPADGLPSQVPDTLRSSAHLGTTSLGRGLIDNRTA